MPKAHNKASDFVKKEDLTELSHEIHTEESKISSTRFRVLNQRN